MASDRTADYPEIKSDIWNWQLAPRRNSRCFIYAEGASRIAITGRGMIECPGARVCELYNSTLWKYRRKEEHFPPRMVLLVCCTDVVLRDFTIKDAAAGWATWILGCRDVNVDNVTMDADLDLPNSDGLHINCSQDVTVSNCRIRTGDDALIIRAYTSVLKNPTPCERIAVTNCTLTSHSSGIRLAWANDGIMRNCVLSNITIADSMGGHRACFPSPWIPQIQNPTRDPTRRSSNASTLTTSYSTGSGANHQAGCRSRRRHHRDPGSVVFEHPLGQPPCAVVPWRGGLPATNITIDNAVFTRAH